MAVALVVEQKVARWTKEMGIETEADLAYWFDSQEQATCEVGTAFCTAWLQARACVAAGVGGLVRDLYAIRVIDEAAPRERPASAVMPRVVVNAASSGACAQLVVSNARHRDLLMRILATSSRYSSHKRREIETTMGGVVQQLLSTTEPATLDRVARTWAELDHYCRGDMAPSSCPLPSCSAQVL